MKFALLGCDSDTFDLASAIAASEEHALGWAHDAGHREPAVRALSPGLVVAEHWEGLLAGTTADVVIVARGADQDQRSEQLRKLAQAGARMIVSHPVVDSMLVYYELDMIRQEGQARLIPYVSQRWHPAWRPLRELFGDGTSGRLGTVEQIVVECVSHSRDRGDVLRAFVRDMEQLRPFCGVLNKVSAMTSSGVRTSVESINYGTLSVQMSSLSSLLVRWSVAVAAEGAGSRVTFIGTRGKAVLAVTDHGPWRLEVTCDGQTTADDFDETNLAAIALPQLLQSLTPSSDANERSETNALERSIDWLDACRTMELADAAQHSLERGRTIELHYETPTEHATFKGVMSGVGCLLLIVGLLVLIVATTAVHAGVPLADYWPQLLLGILVVFLVLQLLRLVFPGAR
jgi:predicted dehydrogenase